MLATKRDKRKKARAWKEEARQEAADAAHKDEQWQYFAEKVGLQEQDNELVKKQRETQIIVKTGKALLTDENIKLTSALIS